MPNTAITALLRLGFLGTLSAQLLQMIARRPAGVPLSVMERDAVERMMQGAMVVYFDYQYQRLAEMLANGISPDWALEEASGIPYLLPSLVAGYQLSVLTAGVEIGGIGVDWTLYNQAASTWAREHTAEVLRTISKTTADRYGAVADEVAEDIAKWIESGEARPKLLKALETKMPADRAAMVSSTETTRVFAKSNEEVWAGNGYWGRGWVTAQDERVCEICQGLDDQVAKHGEAFKHRDTGAEYWQPAHVRCRCGERPILDAPND